MKQIETKLPSISLVTPCLNAEAFIEQTITSVLDQEYPKLQYIIVDGGSTDRTLSIIDKFKSRIHTVISEPDGGNYDALNKGFGAATGDIMGWLNADDMIHHNALFSIGEVFASFPMAHWLTGIPTNIDLQGRFFESHLRSYWDFDALLSGKYGAPQQESTFWRRTLWDAAGGKLDTQLKYAADYDLWCRFFMNADLVSLRSYLGGFRKHIGSLSVKNRSYYQREIVEIAEAYRSKRKVRVSRYSRLFRNKRCRAIIYNPEETCYKEVSVDLRSIDCI